MKLTSCIVACLFLPFSLFANDVVNADSLTSELMTIGYNKALDDAKTYYKKNNIPYDAKLVSDTLNYLAMELNTYIDRRNYKLFLRDNNVTYFNIFLGQKVISISELLFESGFTDEEGGLVCQFKFSWDSTTINNPAGLLKGDCNDKVEPFYFNRRTGIGEDSIYVYYSSEWYTSDNKNGIPDLMLKKNSPAAYNLLLDRVYALSKGNPFTTSGFSSATTFSNEVMDYFNAEGQRVYILSSFNFQNTYSLDYTISYPDGSEDSQQTFLTFGNGKIKNQLPLYPKSSQAVTYNKSVNPFNDLPVRGRFLTGLARNDYSEKRFAEFLNSTWRAVSSRSGYTGIPYRKNYSVTTKMLTEHLKNQGKKFTQLHLYDAISGGRIKLYRWSDTFNAYMSETQSTEGGKVPVDVGSYPNLSLEELTPPELSQSLLPILDSFFFLRQIELKTHSQTCPAISVPFLGQTVSNDTYCTVIDDAKPIIKLFFLLAWTLSGLVIIFRSN